MKSHPIALPKSETHGTVKCLPFVQTKLNRDQEE